MPVEGEARLRAHGTRATGRRTVELFLFGALPLVVFCWWLGFGVLDSSAGDWAFDFRQFWQGGNDVVNGVSPYPSAALLATSGDHLDPSGIQQVFRFPYPAGAAVALAPFGAVGFDAAAAVWGAALIVSLFASVWILRVRDWRVMGIVIGSAPVISAVRLGTLTPVMILLLAVVWRWRESRWVAGSALAAAISLKLFLWPLVVWLAATRRWAAAVIAAAVAATATLAAWAAIGFEGMTDYPELLRRLSDVVADRGYSLVALGVEVGLPQGAAQLLPWVVGLSLLVVVFAVARQGGDRSAFSLAIVAAIVLSPIVWAHYFALLVVPLAVAFPRLSWVWGLMWGFWLIPAQENEGDLWRILLAIVAVAGVLAVSVSARLRPITSR